MDAGEEIKLRVKCELNMIILIFILILITNTDIFWTIYTHVTNELRECIF